MSFAPIGDGVADIPYQEYRDRLIRKLLDRFPNGAIYQVQITAVGTSHGTFPLNVTADEIEAVRALLNGESK